MSLYFDHFVPYLFIKGGIVSVDADNLPTISPGFMRDDTNSVDIAINSAITLYGTVNGVNGLDTGTLQTSKIYAVYAIGDPSGHLPPAGLISLSLVTPQMPSLQGITYGAKRLIGFLRTPSTFSNYNFSRTFVVGQGNFRIMTYNVLDTDIVVSTTSTVSAEIELSSVIPAIEPTIAVFTVSMAGSGGPTGYLSTVSPVTEGSNVRININPVGSLELPVMLNSANKPTLYGLIDSSSSQMYLAILGFKFEV